jgi:hypothetical protein
MTFTFDIKYWSKISVRGKDGLVGNWTDVIYNAFNEQIGCCPLSFKYNKLKRPRSTNKHRPLVRLRAKCRYPTCGHFYAFFIKKEPSEEDSRVTVHVTKSGEMNHSAGELSLL